MYMEDLLILMGKRHSRGYLFVEDKAILFQVIVLLRLE